MLDRDLKKFVSQNECLELAEAMNKKYRMALQGRKFHIVAVNDDSKVQVKVLLKSEDDAFYYPIEARVRYKSEELESYDAALFLIDYIDTYLEEFLLEEDEDLFLTIDWSDHEYEGINFQLKGQIANKKLEDMADALIDNHDTSQP